MMRPEGNNRAGEKERELEALAERAPVRQPITPQCAAVTSV